MIEVRITLEGWYVDLLEIEELHMKALAIVMRTTIMTQSLR